MIIAHNKLYVTNLGDCRAVLGKRDYLSLKYANRVRLLSLDHTAKEEKKRIEEAQCSIIENRIFGRCQFSRSFGDRELKSLPQDKQLSNHVSKTNSSSQPKKKRFNLLLNGLILHKKINLLQSTRKKEKERKRSSSHQLKGALFYQNQRLESLE